MGSILLSVLRTPPVSRQDWIPRALATTLLSSVVGLGLCWVAGWRPLLTEFPINLFAIANDGNYPSGTNIGGIDWSDRFVDLRVVITNETASDYRDLDLTLKPDRPVAEIGQLPTYLVSHFLP